MRACSCGLTSAVGTAISLAGTSRVLASRAKAAVGTATPSARTARCNLKLVLTDRLLLIEHLYARKNPELERERDRSEFPGLSEQRTAWTGHAKCSAWCDEVAAWC